MAEGFGHGRAARRWAFGAATLTTGLALIDAGFPDVVLLGVFVTGPLLCAVRSGPRETALIAAYAIVLGVLSGVWNDIFLDRDHLTRLPGLVIGSLVAVWIADVRLRSERTNDHLVAQNALAVTLVEARSLDDATPRVLSSIGRTLGWELGALWTVQPAEPELRLVDVWKEYGVEAAGFLG